MKNFKTILTLMMVVAVAFSLVACGGNDVAVDYSQSVDGALVVAEAGSAGEELATGDEFFKNAEFTAVDSMATALLDVKSGTSDIAIVDYVTSIGSIGEGTDYTDLAVVEGKDFNPEEYGIAFRKGSDITPAVNAAIAELAAEGKMDEIAAKYKLGDLIIKDGAAFDEEITEGDLAYIKEKGELIVGITLFAPMNYYEGEELIGFETEFAKAVCEKLGVEAKFVEINWNSKEIELNAKNIDCIWNGMTITDERVQNMSISVPYMQNKQVMVSKVK
ncbi:MAG: transporter substrate-binding domain-containing protein [Clostridia bacterium]|nr:transporter substrate-binding domain-containing protein [Clostridia bacterium]